MSDRYANSPPQAHPRIRGRCPSCRSESLFLGSNGYVTCAVIGCKDPGAAHDLLATERAALQQAEVHVGELLQAVSARTSERDQARDAIKTLEQFYAEERAALEQPERWTKTNTDVCLVLGQIRDRAVNALHDTRSESVRARLRDIDAMALRLMKDLAPDREAERAARAQQEWRDSRGYVLPKYVAVVQSPDHHLQLEGHTAEQDWELQLDEQGNIIDFWRSTEAERAARAPTPPPDGAALIVAERRRQVEAEGWTPAHDDTHEYGEMALSAARYAVEHTCRDELRTLLARHWDWGACWWKPKDPIRNLVRAGALIAAEIDRLQRAARGGGVS